MNKRLRVTFALLIVVVAGTALADKKSNPAIVKITRTEGAPIEFAFNPTELTIDKGVPWKKASDSSSEDADLEFTSADPKTLSFQLEFDTFESKENVYEKHVRPLESLAVVDVNLKRPPMVKVVWGGPAVPSFAGVLDSLNVKYTMFLPDGTPVRATVNIRMRSASKASFRQPTPCP